MPFSFTKKKTLQTFSKHFSIERLQIAASAFSWNHLINRSFHVSLGYNQLSHEFTIIFSLSDSLLFSNLLWIKFDGLNLMRTKFYCFRYTSILLSVSSCFPVDVALHWYANSRNRLISLLQFLFLILIRDEIKWRF